MGIRSRKMALAMLANELHLPSYLGSETNSNCRSPASDPTTQKKGTIMKNRIGIVMLAVAGVMLAPVNLSALIVGVAGPASSAGFAPLIVPPPPSVFDSAPGVFTGGQVGFDELQGVVLAVPIAFDGGGLIPVGTKVDSHMIFMNQPDGSPYGTLGHIGVTWTFSGPILGVMSDSDGVLEGLSTGVLGLPPVTTLYPAPYPLRGMEGADGYTIAGSTLTVSMTVTQPGDWIRVVTLSVPDTSSTVVLMGISLLGLMAGYRRFGKSRR